jgi:hypothetical protein
MKYTKQIGSLFLVTMLLSIVGNLTISGLIAGEDFLPQINEQPYKYSLAAVALLLNSLGVLGIGLFTYAVLKDLNMIVARAYLLTRIFEGVILAVGIIFLVSLVFIADKNAADTSTSSVNYYLMAKYAIRFNWYSYNVAMATLGLGSIPFCLLLLRFKLIPKFLSGLGLLGYAVLAVSSLAGLIGIDLGLSVTIPVFFFEVFLGLWLVIKGIKTT